MKFGNFEIPPKKKEEDSIENTDTEFFDNKSSTEERLLNKKDKYQRIPLTEEEKNMPRSDLAKKYNLGRFSLDETRKRGYVVLNSNKSKIRNNEILSMEDNERFIHVPLSGEEINLSATELAKKYGISYHVAYKYKKDGFRVTENPNYINQKDLLSEIREKNKSFLEEVVPVNITSIENVINDPSEQEILKEIVDSFGSYKHTDLFKINQKKFKLLNGKEVFFSDLATLNRIFELKLHRNKDGELYSFYNGKDIKFSPSLLWGSHSRGFTFKDISQKYDDSTKIKKSTNIRSSLESFAPEVFKSGFFKKEDFIKKIAGSASYEIYGPHERTLSYTKPTVFFSNDNGKCIYFLGRDKFVGTDKKINHETVRVSLLDNNNAAITDVIHGRKIILYTFPLINKEEYEKKKQEVDLKFKDKKISKKNYNMYINVGGKEMSSLLVPYKITDYIQKSKNESDIDYAEKVSRLSDISYVLGNFRSFLSETGLAANNYSWSEQLVLADALTGIEQKDKIINFGKNFKRNGMRTFLSIEQGGKEMGDKIIALGDRLPKDIAQKVFAKYGEIIDNVDKITEFTRTNFTKEIETSPELVKKIEETLYIKGKQLLSQTYEDINNKKEVDYEDIGKQLDRINADTITTFAIFKQAVKNGEKLPIESIEGAVFSKKDASSITPIEREEMSLLYDRNYKDHEDRDFINKVKDYFKTAFIPEGNQTKNYFYTFEKDQRIRAFVRFEKQEDKSLYASALNVDDASKNFGLGEAMMDEALSREAKENILHATCLISNPSNMRYFEKGFVSEHFKMVNDTNQFDLVWDEKNNKNILSKQKSIDDLISMYLKNEYESSIEIRRKNNLEDLHNSIPEGKALVRCFVNNGEWYAVYEKLPSSYGLNISEKE